MLASGRGTNTDQTQRWDEIARVQSKNSSLIESGWLHSRRRVKGSSTIHPPLGASMVDGGLHMQKSAWAEYAQFIHEEADIVQGSINTCVQVRLA